MRWWLGETLALIPSPRSLGKKRAVVVLVVVVVVVVLVGGRER